MSRRHLSPGSLVLTACLAAAALVAAPAKAELTAGQTAPNFELPVFQTGTPTQLYDFAGQIVVLDFFATWCPPCWDASSELEAYVHKYYASVGGNPAGIPVQVLSICIDGPDADLYDYIYDFDLNLTLDDRAGFGTVFQSYSTGYIPTFAIVNGVANANYRQWEIVDTMVGYGPGLYGFFQERINTVTRLRHLPGDTDNDGVVDLQDLNNVLNNFGDTGSSPGDDDNNGIVDLADLNNVLNNFGNTAATAALSAVPEPTSLLAACGLALPLLAVHRRHRRPRRIDESLSSAHRRTQTHD